MYAVKNEDDKLFVIRNNDSAYLYQDQNGNLGRMLYRYYSRKDAQRAIERAGHVNQCHVVLLVEKPQPVEVSEDEADKLERAKVYGNPADVILALAANHHPDDAEHILRAYVNGWTVEKPKRYVLPMDGMGDNLGYSYIEDGVWWINTAPTRQYAVEHGYTVTQSDIDAAPDWVKAITPVEVTDNDD